MKSKVILTMTICFSLITSLYLAPQMISAQKNDEQLPPIISTRGDFDKMTAKLNPGINPSSYQLIGAPFPGLSNSSTISCPNTIIIFVHGWGTNQQQAIDNYNSIAPTLSKKGFVAIFSWDSDNFPSTNKSINIVEAGHTAQTIADQNALKLAHFIYDYQTACPAMDIKLMTHSLGNRVVLQTLNVLDQYRIAFPDKWNKLISSVDLMGAGVPSSSVSSEGEFFKGLRMAADIHNYFSNKDPILNILAFADNLSPNDPPLGHTDAPTNAIYNINVTDIVGTDHHAYISPSFMERVIKHWDHRSMFDKNGTLDYSPNSFCYPGIQDCNKGNILLKILDGSSLCNQSIDDCSPQSIVGANLEFLKNRHLLTTKAENEVGQQELSRLSNLFNEVFQGNTTAAPALFDAFKTLTQSSSSVNQTQ